MSEFVQSWVIIAFVYIYQVSASGHSGIGTSVQYGYAMERRAVSEAV